MVRQRTELATAPEPQSVRKMNRMAIREDARNREFEQGCQILLLALTAVALVAVLPAAIELVGATLEPSKSAGVVCNSCGVVEGVRELSRLASKHVGSTVTGGGVEDAAA